MLSQAPTPTTLDDKDLRALLFEGTLKNSPCVASIPFGEFEAIDFEQYRVFGKYCLMSALENALYSLMKQDPNRAVPLSAILPLLIANRDNDSIDHYASGAGYMVDQNNHIVWFETEPPEAKLP
ncbi:MAG: hypothetical protein HGB34_02870 [Candidatus Moranbacteria bacterium]|nr:hypothetical protein [Candidatus Moranbacteria bacterium]